MGDARACAALAVALAIAGCQSKAPVDDEPVDAQGRVDARSNDRPVDASTGPRACKRGVSYNRELAADDDALSRGVGWWYNWSATVDPAVNAAFRAKGIEFVPMIWTGPPRAPIDVDALIRDIPQGAKYLLGFNEPNFGVQANLTPQQAAAAWPLIERIADARNLQIVSPALNYCGGDCNETDPFVWMDAFFEACQGCRVDHVAFHWYACTRDALRNIIGRFEEYGKPLWLTEFSCLDQTDISEPVQQRYMRESLGVLEADPAIFRYAWFIGRSQPAGDPFNLLGEPGRLTALGETYVGFDGACGD